MSSDVAMADDGSHEPTEHPRDGRWETVKSRTNRKTSTKRARLSGSPDPSNPPLALPAPPEANTGCTACNKLRANVAAQMAAMEARLANAEAALARLQEAGKTTTSKRAVESAARAEAAAQAARTTAEAAAAQSAAVAQAQQQQAAAREADRNKLLQVEVAAEKLAQERREANLVVYGVPEDTPLTSVFPDVTIISTRRLGRPQANAPKPRPALVLLPSLDAKRSVMRQFRSRLRAQGITLNHDKTPAQQARCKTLLPRLHYLRSLHKVAFFDYDRLMVGPWRRSSAGGRGRRWEAPPGPPPRPPPPPSPAPAPSGAAGGGSAGGVRGRGSRCGRGGRSSCGSGRNGSLPPVPAGEGPCAPRPVQGA